MIMIIRTRTRKVFKSILGTSPVTIAFNNFDSIETLNNSENKKN